jgi:hypothetical protein
MKKKSDLDNIFDSYMKNIVLNEAVRPVEVTTPQAPLTPQEIAFRDRAKANGKNWSDGQARILYARQQELDKRNNTNYANTQSTTTAAEPTPQPAAQPTAQTSTTQAPVNQAQSSDVVDDEGETWDSVETSTETIPNAVKTYQPSSLGTVTGSQSNTTGNLGNTVTKQVIGSRPANAAGTYNFDGTTVTSTPVAASDEEFKSQDDNEIESDEEEESDDINKNMTPVDEKNMIAKFLKQLSEKNYSSSHKYLKTILEHKVKKALMREIGKI